MQMEKKYITKKKCKKKDNNNKRNINDGPSARLGNAWDKHTSRVKRAVGTGQTTKLIFGRGAGRIRALCSSIRGIINCNTGTEPCGLRAGSALPADVQDDGERRVADPLPVARREAFIAFNCSDKHLTRRLCQRSNTMSQIFFPTEVSNGKKFLCEEQIFVGNAIFSYNFDKKIIVPVSESKSLATCSTVYAAWRYAILKFSII